MSLYVQCRGSGPDLVLIHGWGLHGGIWDALLPALEGRYRVSCVDLPGHGRSEWQGQQTLDDWVAAVLATVPDRAVWLGWSLGGLVATRAALQAPGRVDALVTVASTPCFVRRPGWQSAMLPELLETFSAELEQDYAGTLGRFLALQVRGSEQASAVLAGLRNILLAHGEPDAQALATGLAILRDTDLRDAMQDLRMRLLMIMGERDTLVPVNAGKQTLALCGNAQLAVIDGAGHAPFLAAPGRVVERIDQFLGETVTTGAR